jgi:hypothetical protein
VTKDVAENFVGRAQSLVSALESATQAKLDRLLRATFPKDNFHAPSWRRGIQAAKNVREALQIDVKDDLGADKFFETLEIDTSTRASFQNDGGDIPIAGAVERHDQQAKIALLQPDEAPRRFSAGRAAYLAWVSESDSRRLVTNAVTRDQQASRQFSAELLAPRAYLLSLAGPKRELHYDKVREVALRRRVRPDVIHWQAHNEGIRVGAI